MSLQTHPAAGVMPAVGSTMPDALGFSVPLSPEQVRQALLASAREKSVERGHGPSNLNHYMRTATISWHADGAATIVWEE